ncbi:MAG: hypothetical protein ACE5HI_20205 [bacterium]
MSNSLSKIVNLRVNDFPIVLNDKLNESLLKHHSILKAGLFHRMFLKPPKDVDLFWSKNCVLKYIAPDSNKFNPKEINRIFPITDYKAGADAMCGTTAYLFYKEESLIKFLFQIISNKYMALVSLEDFEKKLIIILGKPLASSNMKTWEVEEQILILEYPHKNGYIHLMFNY